MRRFTDAGIAVCQLGIRLSYHRNPRVNLFQCCMAAKDAECAPFQHSNMESPNYHVVNCDCHMVGWSRAQCTKYVSYPHSLHIIVSRRPVLVLKDLTMVREVSRCKSD